MADLWMLEATMFKRGDRVEINKPKDKKVHGRQGKLTDMDRGNVWVKLDNGDEIVTRMAMLIKPSVLEEIAQAAVRLDMNTGEEVGGPEAVALLSALKKKLEEARAYGEIEDYREDGMSKREAELEWLFEAADFEVSEEVLNFLYGEVR